MSDPHDFRRSTGMQLRDENLMYDDFYVVPPWTFGRFDIDQGPRQPDEGWLARAQEALTFSRVDTRFASLVSRFSRMFEW